VILADEMPDKILPAEGPLDILYEDEDLICLNKPAGLVVHPSHGHFADTLANYLAHYFLKNGEPHEIRTVGRLDKDTSGVICFAKSRTAAAIMAGQTGEGAAQKTYLALAEGTFDENAGEVDAPISREYEEKIRRVVREDGAHAVTHYRVVTQYAGYALVRLSLETGRTHQIRVHMAHIGHPLLGDPIYGSARPGLARAALHAASISMKQPFTRQALMITAPLPEDMAVYIK
jgi:23S rRNA pseudouridine1911/1915/1917 synthase